MLYRAKFSANLQNEGNTQRRRRRRKRKTKPSDLSGRRSRTMEEEERRFPRKTKIKQHEKTKLK
jgi:hypothetical protein